MEFLTALKDTPLPTILVIGGIVFLLLGIATIKKPIVIDVTPSNRKIALTVGILLVGGGVFLMVQPNPEKATTTETVIPTEILVIQNNRLETNTPTILVTPSVGVVASSPKNLVITEVLGNPCGADARNEFIEIYNSGDTDIDMSGLLFTDGEEAEVIVTWGSRYPTVNLGAVTNTTLIPPHGFAVILAPGYPFVTSDRIMPYRFPPATIILTAVDGQLLGDENDGIEVTNRDPIVLYQGDKNNISTVISTYGSPVLGGSPLSSKDDNMDKIPFNDSSFACWSVQRIIPANEDIDTNWKITETSSPGAGNYPQ
ncbi:MAG: lamin tail domain-containing protein [Chloroflexi bacterium]|nr:lamin tail domain-containing protein [Chloroflexota bacterium]